jgi:hypothetical protein
MPSPLETMSRQKKFLEIYKETKDPVLASGEVWPELPPRRRAMAAKRVLTQPEVSKLLARYNLSLPKIAQRHSELMGSERDEVAMRAVELGYKVHGVMKAVDTPEAQQVQITIDPGKLAEVAARLEAINKKMIPSYAPIATDADIV